MPLASLDDVTIGFRGVAILDRVTTLQADARALRGKATYPSPDREDGLHQRPGDQSGPPDRVANSC